MSNKSHNTFQVNLLKEQMFGDKQEDKPSPEAKENEELKEKVTKLEGLLARYKEGLKLAKEKITTLAKEKDLLNVELKAKVEELSKQQVRWCYIVAVVCFYCCG